MNETPSPSGDKPPLGSWLSLAGSVLMLLSFIGQQWSPYPGPTDSFSNRLYDSFLCIPLIGAVGVLALAFWKILLGSVKSNPLSVLLWLFTLVSICPILLIVVVIPISTVMTRDFIITIASLLTIVSWAGAIWNFRRRPTHFSLGLLIFVFAFWPITGIVTNLRLYGFQDEGWSLWLWPLGGGLILSGAIAVSVSPPQPSPSQ